MGISELSTIQTADHIIAKALKYGMEVEMNYKDIYKLCKERIIIFAEIRGVTGIELTRIDK